MGGSKFEEEADKMPIENMEEEGLRKVPNLDIAQVKFQLQHCTPDTAEKKRLRDELMQVIKKDEMGGFYVQCVKDGLWKKDDALAKELDDLNKKQLETVSTFTSYELMSYEQFVKYCVYASVIALDRGQLHDKVVKGSEIAEVMHGEPDVQAYLMAFYNCHYSDFFTHLARVEQIAKTDRCWNPDYAFYVREMKIKAFAQLLVLPQPQAHLHRRRLWCHRRLHGQ